MTSQTIPLFFKVSPELIQEKSFDDLLNDVGRICLDDVAKRQDMEVGNGDKIVTMISKNTSHLSMRVYALEGIITIDISYMCDVEYKDHFEVLEILKKRYSLKGKGDTWQEFIINRLEDGLRDYLGDKCLKLETMHCPVRRGDALWTYMTSSAERILEMDYDKLVYRSFSDMQKIEIFHSPLHGNAYFLDGVIMNSEKDQDYNDLLFGVGKQRRNDYKEKNILLLGGGGGSGFNCLLQEEPNMVVMCEVDGEVVDACRTHMRKICGTSLDTMEGPHHKIIIGDGFKVLRDAVKDGKKYDYVVDEMSMFVVAPESNERDTDMVGRNNEALSLSKQVLKPGGIYFQALDPYPAYVHTNFQKAVDAVGGKLTRRESVCIPSYLENYIFYEVTFPEDDAMERR